MIFGLFIDEINYMENIKEALVNSNRVRITCCSTLLPFAGSNLPYSVIKIFPVVAVDVTVLTRGINFGTILWIIRSMGTIKDYQTLV